MIGVPAAPPPAPAIVQPAAREVFFGRVQGTVPRPAARTVVRVDGRAAAAALARFRGRG